MDKVQSLIVFWMTHQVVIIEVLFSVILATIAIWLFANLRRESRENPDLKEIEESLKKVLLATGMQSDKKAKDLVGQIKETDSAHLEATSAVPSAAAPIAAVVPPPAANNEQAAKEVAELKAQLAKAQEEIKKAKAAPAAATGGNAAEFETLKKKAEELETRLSEYAIIEDDIANLNLYKDENVRLKDELERLKSSGPAPAATPAPAPAAAPAAASAAPAPAPSGGDDLADALAQELEKSLLASGMMAPEAGSKEAKPSPQDLVDQLAAQVDQAPKAAAPSPQDLVDQLAAQADQAPKAVAPSPQDLVDQLAAQAEQTPKPVASPPPPAATAQVAPTPPVAEKNPPLVANEEVNPDKLLAEFDSLVANPPPEQKDDGKDPGDKLVEEFENFLKSSGGPTS